MDQECSLNLLILFFLAEVILSIGAIIGNSVVIYVMWKEKKLRKKSHYHVLSVAFCDLLVGVIGIPVNIIVVLRLFSCNKMFLIILIH